MSESNNLDGSPRYSRLVEVDIKDVYPKLSIQGDQLTIQMPMEHEIPDMNLDITQADGEKILLHQYVLPEKSRIEVDLSPMRLKHKVGDQFHFKIWKNVYVYHPTLGNKSAEQIYETRQQYGLGNEDDPIPVPDAWVNHKSNDNLKRDDVLIYTFTLKEKGWEISLPIVDGSAEDFAVKEISSE